MLPLIFTLLSFFLMVGGTSLEAQGVKTVPPMLGARVPFLVGEHMPHSQKLNKIKIIQKIKLCQNTHDLKFAILTILKCTIKRHFVCS